ncbi:hypothetical protein HPB50_007879 [Hyalomma asiaticum]|uniref:Uncharacterized protein n=1 Tax=Hyalomma asiaticum TaxID=266040 RepID=A0ACB7TEG6_HYAAI|nr:hypothetical protein HPB50_007879 [Hyalomma asiaticum]
MYDRRKHHQRWCARPGIHEREKLGDAVKVLFVVRNCDVDTWIPTTSVTLRRKIVPTTHLDLRLGRLYTGPARRRSLIALSRGQSGASRRLLINWRWRPVARIRCRYSQPPPWREPAAPSHYCLGHAHNRSKQIPAADGRASQQRRSSDGFEIIIGGTPGVNQITRSPETTAGRGDEWAPRGCALRGPPLCGPLGLNYSAAGPRLALPLRWRRARRGLRQNQRERRRSLERAASPPERPRQPPPRRHAAVSLPSFSAPNRSDGHLPHSGCRLRKLSPVSAKLHPKRPLFAPIKAPALLSGAREK